MLRIPCVATILFVLISVGWAQGQEAPRRGPGGGEQRPEQNLGDTVSWRCIGPANMGGRVVDFAVSQQDPSTFWVATASGGLLKTVNNGMTFTNQFDHESTVSIGDVCVAPSNHDIVWLGTGENNPRNSVSFGDGVYKSTDGGKTWKNMGLKDSYQIGRIAIHPENADIVYVGALGRLWGANEDRGLYKTTDGGTTWQRILYVDDKTGVIDVQMQPGNPEQLLVATYERMRDGTDDNDPIKKIGPGSGLYLTTNGGASFDKVTQGLPAGALGRIGVDFYRKDPNVAYAIVEAEQIGKIPDNAGDAGLTTENAEVGAKVTRVTVDGPAAGAGIEVGDIVLRVGDATVLSSNDLQEQIRSREAGTTVPIEVARAGKSKRFEVVLAKASEDVPPGRGGAGGGGGRRRGGAGGGEPGQGEPAAAATDRPAEAPTEVAAEGADDPRRNAARTPFSSGLGGQRENIQRQQGKNGHEYGGLYRSADGGRTWTRVNSVNPRPMYFSQVRVDPNDEQFLYVLGISMYRSKDGGATFTDDAGSDVHPDQHALWIDPRDGRHMIVGCDGGMYVTYDRCDHWDHVNHVAIGQFYHVAVDSRRDYRVYGGLQDNGTWGASHRSRTTSGPINEDWISVGGGDGFVVQVDPNEPDLVYYESQNGGMGRINLRTGERGGIRPPRGQRGTRYRFNWKTPFILSNHNSRIFYAAAQFVFKSLDRGNDLRIISPEITRTDKGTATALAESPRNPDLLYVGSDDGALQRTKNGGREWLNLAVFADSNAGKVQENVTTQVEPAAKAEARSGPFVDDTAGKQDAGGDPISGEWSGKVTAEFIPDDRGHFTMVLKMAGGKITGSIDSEQGDSEIKGGTYNAATGEVELNVMSERGEATWHGKLAGTKLTGQLEVFGGQFRLDFEAERKAAAATPATPKPAVTVAPQTQETKPAEAKPADGKPTEAPTTEAAVASDNSPQPLGKLLPRPMWISSIETSRVEEGRVYMSVDGHRSNDDQPYLLVSEDSGDTWRSLRGNLPVGSARVIREDLKNPNVLYAGTEFGAWFSLDRGTTWTRFSGLPTVAVHEFAQHPTSGELIAATHGRSLWIADVSALRQLTPEAMQARAFLCKPTPVVAWRGEPSRGTTNRRYVGNNPPDGTSLSYHLKTRAQDVTIKITDVDGKTVKTLTGVLEPGLHSVAWNLRRDARGAARPGGPGGFVPGSGGGGFAGGGGGGGGGGFGRGRFGGGRVAAGKYRVELNVDDEVFTAPLEIERDPRDVDLGITTSADTELEQAVEEDEDGG